MSPNTVVGSFSRGVSLGYQPGLVPVYTSIQVVINIEYLFGSNGLKHATPSALNEERAMVAIVCFKNTTHAG